MKCPDCENLEDKVIETRESKERNYIRRRRECLQCGRRFTTYEKVEEIPLVVVKKDGRREVFDLDKVRKGLYRAVEKRPIPTKQIEQIAVKVEEFVSSSEKEVSTKAIGEHINPIASAELQFMVCEIAHSEVNADWYGIRLNLLYICNIIILFGVCFIMP